MKGAEFEDSYKVKCTTKGMGLFVLESDWILFAKDLACCSLFVLHSIYFVKGHNNRYEVNLMLGSDVISFVDIDYQVLLQLSSSSS